MKFLALLTTTAIFGHAMASPTALEQEISEAPKLDKRACSSLSYASMFKVYFVIPTPDNSIFTGFQTDRQICKNAMAMLALGSPAYTAGIALK